MTKEQIQELKNKVRDINFLEKEINDLQKMIRTINNPLGAVYMIGECSGLVQKLALSTETADKIAQILEEEMQKSQDKLNNL